jgi:hypothetical protein
MEVTLKQFLLITLMICAATLASAQQPEPDVVKGSGAAGVLRLPGAPYALTEQEQKEWTQFGETEKALLQTLQGTASQARSLSAADAQQAVQYLAAMKEIYSSMDANALRRELWLTKLQAAKGCPDCKIEGKELVRAAKKE